MDDLFARYWSPASHVRTLDELLWVVVVSDVVLQDLVGNVLDDRALVGKVGVGRVGSAGHGYDLTNERIRVYRLAPAEVSLMMFLRG